MKENIINWKNETPFGVDITEDGKKVWYELNGSGS